MSALVPGDAHHAASRSWLEAEDARDHLLVAPALLLPEVASAIARRTGRAALGHRAVAWLSRMPALRLVGIDEALAEDAAKLAAERRLRGADAIYVAVAAQLELDLVTWDREQIARAAAVVRVATP